MSMEWNLKLLKHDNILNNISGVTFSLMNKKSKKYSFDLDAVR